MDETRFHVNRWATDLYRPHGELDVDYMLIDGGRASSKTWEVTQALAVKAAQRPMRIAIAREHLKSIEESAKPELESRIKALGLPGYRIMKNSIEHENGSHFFFIGLSRMSEEDIKGLAAVDIAWVEEAHRMSHGSWELLRPTIRKDDAQIWATWNPKYRTDAISQFQRAVRHDRRVWYRRVNWRDNAYFTKRSNRDRIRDKNDNPERYAHIWEGEYDDVSAKRKVLPYALARLCVDAWDRRPVPRGAFVEAGLDVADTGLDKNALVLRSGPELFHVETWRGSQSFTPSDSTRHAKRVCDEHGVARFRYDAGGVGAAVRGPLIEMNPEFQVRGVQFGGKVDLPDATFLRRATTGARSNSEYFANWASQAGWVPRLRAMNTQRLVDGEVVDAADCLFIHPELPHLEDVLAELAQPEWTDRTGKLKIEKQPHEAGEAEPPSPDCWDGTILAYGGDAGRAYRLMRQ